MAPLSRTVTAVTLAVCCTAAAFAPPTTFALEASATSPDRISKSGSTARDLRPGSPTAAKSYASWRRWRSHKGTFSAPKSGDSALQHHLGADEVEKDFVLTLPTQEQSLRGGGVSGGQAPVTTMPKQRAPRARVAFYLAVWYSFTIGYNIYNKATLNRIAAPWTLATVQLAIGSLYVCGIWLFGVRMAPKVTTKSLKAVLPLSCLHSLAHIASLMALTLGALGYFQIVKVGIFCIAYRVVAFCLVQEVVHSRDYGIWWATVRITRTWYTTPQKQRRENYYQLLFTSCSYYSTDAVHGSVVCPPS